MDTRTGQTTAEPSSKRGRIPDDPDFWRLWVTGLVIFVVRWMEMLAAAIFAYQKTESAFIVAFLTMLRMLPMGLFGAFIGALADRVERRTALIVVVATMFSTSAVLAVLAHYGRLEVWHLAVVAFINGVGWATDNPVRRMMIGEVVGADRMGLAMSIDVGANNASRVAGPAIGGALLAWIGIEGAFTLSVSLYVIALIAAVSLRARNGAVSTSSEFLLTRILAGLTVIKQSPPLQGTLLITSVFNIFGWPFTSMIPVIARDRLHLAPDEIGLLASMDGLGAFFGAVAVAFFGRPSNYSRIYIGSVAGHLVMLMVFAWSPTVVLAAAALFVMGFTQSGFSILQATLVFRSAPQEMRARMLGVLAVCIGVGPIGFMHIGVLADLVGAPVTAIVTGLDGLVALALTYRFWRPLWEQV